MDDQIRHVSDTALMVAACRAIETEHADALVRDPFAQRLAGFNLLKHGLRFSQTWLSLCINA